MRFSERIGVVKPRYEPQVDDIDKVLRNRIWNVVSLEILGRNICDQYGYLSPLGKRISKSLYIDHLVRPHDEAPGSPSKLSSDIKGYIQHFAWEKVYDLVEWITPFAPNQKLVESSFNKNFERELSAYRMVNGGIVQIDSKNEIAEVNNAIAVEGKFASASKHLASAVTLLSDRQNPDFPNSIKESISAVEAVAKILTGEEKPTLGKALKTLEKEGHLHKGLAEAYMKIYGWTCSESGIRHANMDMTNVTLADARYMLVSCSAFVNYLISNAENT